MVFLRNTATLTLVVLLGLAVTDADAAKKKKNKPVQGSVTAVEAGQNAGEGTLTVKAVAKKGGAAREVKIQVKSDTKLERMIGKKKDNQTSSAAFADLQAGRTVSITLRSGTTDQAERVLLAKTKKKKQAN